MLLGDWCFNVKMSRNIITKTKRAAKEPDASSGAMYHDIH